MEYKNNWHEQELSKHLYFRLDKDTKENPKAFLFLIDYSTVTSPTTEVKLIRPYIELENILP